MIENAELNMLGWFVVKMYDDNNIALEVDEARL